MEENEVRRRRIRGYFSPRPISLPLLAPFPASGPLNKGIYARHLLLSTFSPSLVSFKKEV